jgi:hypothetical protein
METSFKQLEANFQRKLNEYQTTYKDYMVALNQELGNYWNVQENVTVANKDKSAMIPYVHMPDISQKDCLHACSSDPKCNYVLFSDSGNGACAANQCLKWTKEANGLVMDNNNEKTFDIYVGNSNENPKLVTLPVSGLKFPKIVPNPTGERNWPNIHTAVKDGNILELTRVDKNSGWDEIIELEGILPPQNSNVMKNIACTGDNNELSLGPAETNYIYNGWKKPYWEDTANTTFMGNPETANMEDWRFIGNTDSLAACKEMSYKSNKGPFNSVVFYPNSMEGKWKNSCYGGVPSAKFNNAVINGVYSSIPPLGSTNLGGLPLANYVVKLRKLNDELKNDIQTMTSEVKKFNSEDVQDQKKIEQTHKNLMSDLKKLKKDRVEIDAMERELNNLDAKLGILDRVTTREKILYMGSVLAVLLILGFMIKRYS